jgi:hypothetical protein
MSHEGVKVLCIYCLATVDSARFSPLASCEDAKNTLDRYATTARASGCNLYFLNRRFTAIMNGRLVELAYLNNADPMKGPVEWSDASIA